MINASFWLSSESSKQRKSREQQQTRKGLLACLRCLAREKRGGLAACRLGTCVIGGGGLVAWARQIWSSARRTRGLASCGRATIVACIRITSHELLRDGIRAAAAFLLRRPHRAGFLSGSFSSFPRIWLASLIQQKSGPKAPLSPPQMGTKARAGCQVGPGPLPALITVQVGASASAPARRALTLSAPGQGGS